LKSIQQEAMGIDNDESGIYIYIYIYMYM
jgi:hypothetical protein